MKRMLVAVPLASLAIGLFLLLWHRAVREPSAGTGDTKRQASSATPVPGPPLHPPRVSKHALPAAVPVRPSGALRLFVHAGGRGVGNARFTLLAHDELSRYQETTQPDGTQTLFNVPTGSFEVVVNHPKYLPATATIYVEAGKSAELVVELKEGGRLQGLVTGPAGQPLAGVDVFLLDLRTQLLLHPDLKTRTDLEGRYLLEGIPFVDTAAIFRHARFRPLTRGGLSFRFPGETRSLNVSLDPGTLIAGRVVDEAGLAISDANVTAGNEHVSIARSDREGAFTLYGLGDQPVNCSISARGFGTVIVRGVKPNTTNLEVRLPKGGRLQGTVVGAQVPDVFAVILVRYEEDLGKELRVQTQTFQNLNEGAFELNDVAPGVYWVEVEAEGFEAAERPQVVVYAGQAAGAVKIPLQKKR